MSPGNSAHDGDYLVRRIAAMTKGITGPDTEYLPSKLKEKTSGGKAISDAGMWCD